MQLSKKTARDNFLINQVDELAQCYNTTKVLVVSKCTNITIYTAFVSSLIL